MRNLIQRTLKKVEGINGTSQAVQTITINGASYPISPQESNIVRRPRSLLGDTFAQSVQIRWEVSADLPPFNASVLKDGKSYRIENINDRRPLGFITITLTDP